MLFVKDLVAQKGQNRFFGKLPKNMKHQSDNFKNLTACNLSVFYQTAQTTVRSDKNSRHNNLSKI